MVVFFVKKISAGAPFFFMAYHGGNKTAGRTLQDADAPVSQGRRFPAGCGVSRERFL
jgi:hypothetical protein